MILGLLSECPDAKFTTSNIHRYAMGLNKVGSVRNLRTRNLANLGQPAHTEGKDWN